MLRLSAVVLLALLGACAGGPEELRPDARLQCRPAPETVVAVQDRGMGGTGIDRGMGGTGIRKLGVIGTVTGFGSICVNGLQVSYDAGTPVTANGAPAGVDLLARGTTVAVTAEAVAGAPHLAASAIDIVHALVGPVTSGSKAPGGLAVMGVRVETGFAADSDVASLIVGDMVIVDGLQRADGVIDATRVAKTAASRASVRGALTLDAGPLRVAGVSVTISGSPVPLAPALNGRWVLAEGTWADGGLTAEKVAPGIPLESAAVERLSVEGYIIALPDRGYAVRGVRLRADEGRRLDRGTFERLVAGPRVQVIGARDRDGGLRIERVIVPDFLSPLVEADAATQTTRPLQQQRGTYESVTRPAVIDATTRPETVPTRPLPQRPVITRPPPPRRGG